LLDKKYWSGLIEWMKAVPLERSLVGEKDFSFIHIVDTPEEVFEILSTHHKEFRERSMKPRDPS
jgi:predicted Rossmann-fold nucleotide-binding protein